MAGELELNRIAPAHSAAGRGFDRSRARRRSWPADEFFDRSDSADGVAGMVKQLRSIVRKVRSARGIALLATMLAIAMMTIIVIDFTSSSAMGYLSAANHANEIRAEYLARSAVNVGLALIAQDTRTQMAQQQSNASGLGGQQPFDSFASGGALPC